MSFRLDFCHPTVNMHRTVHTFDPFTLKGLAMYALEESRRKTSHPVLLSVFKTRGQGAFYSFLPG